MPYTAKNGSAVPLFVQLNAHQVVHGDCLNCKCPCCDFNCCECPCDYGCLECDMSCCISICAPCKAGCKPVCDAVLNCEKMCQAKLPAMCDIGPELGCKAVGAELTCGIAALEGLCGVWHVGNDMFPEMLPSVLFPCCCFTVPIPAPGQDNTSGGDWAPGGPTTSKVKICKSVCGDTCVMMPCCNLHKNLSMGACGLCMDPMFGGTDPFWFKKAFKMPYIKMKAKGPSA